MSGRSQRHTFTAPALLPAAVPGLAQPAGPTPVCPTYRTSDSADLTAPAEEWRAAGTG